MKKLKSHLPRHGIPDEVMSDNGQPFSSAESHGFKYITQKAKIYKSPASISLQDGDIFLTEELSYLAEILIEFF